MHDNPDVFTQTQLLNVKTSLDSLATTSPFFGVMSRAPVGNDVKYHNIVGNVPKQALAQKVGFSGQGDGVVELASAKSIAAVSEIEVNSEHVRIHLHPQSVLEVRRILIQHLVDLDRANQHQFPVLQTGYQSTGSAPFTVPVTNAPESETPNLGHQYFRGIEQDR